MDLLLQQEGEVVRDVPQLVVVAAEGAVELEPEQLGADGGDPVVGEREARDLQVVLPHHVQHLVAVLAQLVVRQVQHLHTKIFYYNEKYFLAKTIKIFAAYRGLAGQGGEGGEVCPGAVDDDGVGRHGRDVDPRREVVEVTGAGGGAVRRYLPGPIRLELVRAS